MTTVVAYPLRRDVVSVRGGDAVDYLQGQLSQDVAALGVGDTAWSFVLQPQGKVDGWFRLSRLDDASFVLDTDPGAGGDLVARLERFRLRVDAEISTLPWSVVALRGADGELDHLDTSGAEVVAPVAFGPMVGVDLLGPDVAAPDGTTDGSADAYERLRIAAGVPVVGAELTSGTIPAEAGVVPMSVSFTKGCFTGQELVARIDSRGGKVPRHLRGVVVADAAPPVGAELRVGDDVVGSLTSVAATPEGGGAVALGYVKRSIDVPAVVDIMWDGHTAPGEVRALPLALDP